MSIGGIDRVGHPFTEEQRCRRSLVQLVSGPGGRASSRRGDRPGLTLVVCMRRVDILASLECSGVCKCFASRSVSEYIVHTTVCTLNTQYVTSGSGSEYLPRRQDT